MYDGCELITWKKIKRQERKMSDKVDHHTLNGRHTQAEYSQGILPHTVYRTGTNICQANVLVTRVV